MHDSLIKYRRRLDTYLIDDDGQVSFGYPKDAPDGEYLEVPFTTYSNYSGSTVEHSNCDVFLKRFGAIVGVHEMYGGHSSRGILIEYQLYENNEDIKEAIDSLFKYPVLDEDDLTNLEAQLEDESWEGWVKDDLIHELEKRGIEYSDDDNELHMKFNKVINEADIYFIFEDAVSAYIDIEEVVNNWTD